MSDEDTDPLVQPSSDRWFKVRNMVLKCGNAIAVVEIPVFLYFLSLGMGGAAPQSFVYSRICLRDFKSEEICANLDKDKVLSEYEYKVQAGYADYSTLSTVFSNVPGAFVTVFMGMVCDRLSYLAPLIIPHLGVGISWAMLLFFTYLPPSSTSNLILASPALFMGFSGNFTTISISGFAYISQITHHTDRTFRFAGIEASITIGTALGFFISGALLTVGGPPLVFLVQIAIHLFSIVFIFAFIPELHSKGEIKHRIQTEARGSLLRYLFLPGKLAGKSPIFGKSFEEETANLVQGNRFDPRIWLLLLASATGSGVLLSMNSIFYEFVTSEPISMPANVYSILQGVNLALNGFNLLVTIRFMRKKFSDSALMTIGAISRISAFTAIGFGDFYPSLSPWAYTILLSYSPFFSALLRTLMSRLAGEKIRGGIFAVSAFCDTAAHVLMTLLFNNFYSDMLKIVEPDGKVSPFVHGLAFFAADAFLLTPLFVSIWFCCQERSITARAGGE